MSIYFIPAAAYLLMAIIYTSLAIFMLDKSQTGCAVGYSACSAIHVVLSIYYYYVIAAELVN